MFACQFLSRKNYRLYFIYTLAKRSLMWHYVIVIYYQAHNLTFTEIAAIATVGSISRFIMEIPTGVISDYMSRKLSLQISELLKFVLLLIVAFSPTFPFLCLAAFIWGIADSCQSETAEAIIYEMFEDKNELELYKEYLSKISIFSFIAGAMATFFALTLFSIKVVFPVIASLISVSVSFASISLIKYTPKRTNESKGNVFEFNLLVLKNIFRSNRLLLFLIVRSFAIVVIATVNRYTQSLLLDKKLNIVYLGSIMLVYNLYMPFGSKISSKFPKWMNEYTILLCFGVLSIIAGASPLGIAFAAILLFCFFNGAFWPVFAPKVNSVIDSHIRASDSHIRAAVLSYQSMFLSAFFIIVEPLVGVAIDAYGLRIFYILFGIATMLITFAFMMISNKCLKFDIEQM